MFALCASDDELSGFDLSTYGYPTKLIRLPFMERAASLKELADGLRTELRARGLDQSDLVLVGHSLGGLVVRRYVLDEVRSGRKATNIRLALFAVPNTGADLAKFGALISRRHPHLAELRKESSSLSDINEQWLSLEVERHLETRYFVGGADGVVDALSACPLPGATNKEVLIGHNHTSIVAPEDHNDIRYLALKSFILNKPIEPPAISSIPVIGDPLFEIYSPQNEQFYVERTLDINLAKAIAAGNVWLQGPSGTGKTAALCRAVLRSGWRLQHVMLASYEDRTAIGMLRAICLELPVGRGDVPPKGCEYLDYINYVKSALTAFPDKSAAILVEELPLSEGPEFDLFLQYILKLLLAFEADPNLKGRVVLAFTSISDPRAAIGKNGGKLLNRLQVLPLPPWTLSEALALTDLLATSVKPDLTPTEREQIAGSANGYPRFIKRLFRRWRNGTDEGLTLEGLLIAVADEHI